MNPIDEEEFHLRISVNEFNDGEIFMLTAIDDDDEEVESLIMTRQCALQVVQILNEMLGDIHDYTSDEAGCDSLPSD